MSEYFFDSGSENAKLREVFQYDALGKKLTKYADAFKKAEKKIHDKYDKLDKDLQKKEEAEMSALVITWQKKIKIVVPDAE